MMCKRIDIVAYLKHHCCLILQKDEVYLNLVLDFVPETVYRVIRHHSKAKQIMPTLYVKVSGLGARLQWVKFE